MIQYPKYCLVWDTVPKYYLVWDTGPKIQYPGLVWDDTVSKIPSGLGWYSTQNTDWFGMIQYPKYCLIWDCTIYTILSDLGLYSMHHTDLNCIHYTVWYGTVQYASCWYQIVQYAPYRLIWTVPYVPQSMIWDCTACIMLIWDCTVCTILSDLGLYGVHRTVWFGIVCYASYCLIWDCTVCTILSDFGWYGKQAMGVETKGLHTYMWSEPFRDIS